MRREIRRPPIGSQPGTLAIDPDSPQPILRVTSYDEDSVAEHESISVDDVADLVGKARKIWIDVQGLGDEGLLSNPTSTTTDRDSADENGRR